MPEKEKKLVQISISILDYHKSKLNMVILLSFSLTAWHIEQNREGGGM